MPFGVVEGASRSPTAQSDLSFRLSDLRRIVRSLRQREPQILLAGLFRGGEDIEMNKYEAIFRYKASMALFHRWLSEGVISTSDLAAMDAALAQKYGLSNKSIYRENNLLCKENGVIYSSAKGGRYEQEDHQN
jgi:hypothetical protein